MDIKRTIDKAAMGLAMLYSPTQTPDFQSDISDTLMIRIPGRSAARGEVTHKTFKQMNRAERRAVASNSKR